LKTVGMPYKSPHAFRHGHIRFLRNCASDVRDLEAIAHNALQTVGTMLNYGKLDSTQALETVASLCNGKWSSSPVHEGSIPDQQTIQVVLNYLLQASGRE
jgi:hypothetical protein